MDLKRYIEAEGIRLGFSKIGVAPAEFQPAYHDKFINWLKSGHQARMDYLERDTRRRFDPKIHLPGAASVIVCAHNYYTAPTHDPRRGYVSIYARGDDYHDVISDKLRALCRKIGEQFGEFNYRIFVDSSPISEKTFAVLAGIGFIGRNNTVIIPKDKSRDDSPRGSFHFLGVIISDLQLEPDDPIEGTCGKCTRCIDACPTDAIIADKVIDARRCISYHTTQNKNDIPADIAAKMKNSFLGCDICQTVCPYNSSSLVTSEPRFDPRDFLVDLDPGELLDITDEKFHEKYKGTIVADIGLKRAKRNAVVTANNIE